MNVRKNSNRVTRLKSKEHDTCCQHTNILIVEDDDQRIKWFRVSLKSVEIRRIIHIANYAEEAIKLLSENTYDVMFLDHDLGLRENVPSYDDNTGYAVAKFMRMTNNPNTEARIIVHSCNLFGAANIASILPDSLVIPFTRLRENWQQIRLELGL